VKVVEEMDEVAVECANALKSTSCMLIQQKQIPFGNDKQEKQKQLQIPTG
jgi:hypothetical protein